MLPTFGPTVYNVAVANGAINSGIAASTASSDNAAALNAYITYCSSHGGGTVEIPSGTFLSSTVTIKSNVNLQLDSGAILRDAGIANTLITSTGTSSNIQISGSGTLDGAATTAVGTANLVDLRNVTTLAILGVSIVNSGHEHLVSIHNNNVTISGININDQGTLAANHNAYLANTDGIDYSGNNYLIKNCVIADGDDDIVAKPASFACTNITITNCTIGNGHGISVGGGSAKGVTNLNVNNVSFNGTAIGLRLKAADVVSTDQDAGGGLAHPVQGVSYSNITMTNVDNPILITSFYDNGSNNFPASPTDTTHYPITPATVDATTPMREGISFANITATGASNAGLIYGLKTTSNNLDGLTFSNVNVSANSHMDLWYAANVDLSGLHITVPSGDAYAQASPVAGARLFAVTVVPEPAPAGLCMAGLAIFALRHGRSGRRWIRQNTQRAHAKMRLNDFSCKV